MENVAAIVLAAGRGKRMNSKNKNKVMLDIHDNPMLLTTIKTLRKAKVTAIVVVVGFAKGSVVNLLDKDIIVADQKDQLGTGDAVKAGLGSVPDSCRDVLIIYGDDAFMHSPKTFEELLKAHKKDNATVTFITMDIDDPTGLGRIIRDGKEEIVGIVEEKNATALQKKIKEINLGCYVINKEYLKKSITLIQKNEISGEYYITDVIGIVASRGDRISSYKLRGKNWRGVNTRDDLKTAENLAKNP